MAATRLPEQERFRKRVYDLVVPAVWQHRSLSFLELEQAWVDGENGGTLMDGLIKAGYRNIHDVVTHYSDHVNIVKGFNGYSVVPGSRPPPGCEDNLRLIRTTAPVKKPNPFNSEKGIMSRSGHRRLLPSTFGRISQSTYSSHNSRLAPTSRFHINAASERPWPHIVQHASLNSGRYDSAASSGRIHSAGSSSSERPRFGLSNGSVPVRRTSPILRAPISTGAGVNGKSPADFFRAGRQPVSTSSGEMSGQSYVPVVRNGVSNGGLAGSTVLKKVIYVGDQIVSGGGDGVGLREVAQRAAFLVDKKPAQIYVEPEKSVRSPRDGGRLNTQFITQHLGYPPNHKKVEEKVKANEEPKTPRSPIVIRMFRPDMTGKGQVTVSVPSVIVMENSKIVEPNSGEDQMADLVVAPVAAPKIEKLSITIFAPKTEPDRCATPGPRRLFDCQLLSGTRTRPGSIIPPPIQTMTLPPRVQAMTFPPSAQAVPFPPPVQTVNFPQSVQTVTVTIPSVRAVGIQADLDLHEQEVERMDQGSMTDKEPIKVTAVSNFYLSRFKAYVNRKKEMGHQ